MEQEPADRYEKPGSGNDPKYASLRADFRRQFGGDDTDLNPHNDAPIYVCVSPGRVNLIGEHTDYNDGFVFPMAIRPHIVFAFRRRNDGQVQAYSDQGDETIHTFTIDVDAPGEPFWTNYLRGPIAQLRQRGETLTGMDCYLMSSLPVGAGLSSSAALEVGTTVSMLHLSGGNLDVMEIAKLCQKAEHEYANVPCGIMDMTIVAAGKADHAMMLDCRTMERTYVPLPEQDVAVVICDSKAEHALSGGEYRERRESCEAAARQLGVSVLRDATPDQVEAAKDQLGDRLYRRAKHVVTENARCQAFASALRSGDYAKAGEQMYASHASLSDDYEVSTPELDFLVETAKDVDGVYGSRMTGAGFGGCTVTLCRPDAVDVLSERLASAMKEKFGIDTFPFATKAMDGAKVVD